MAYRPKSEQERILHRLKIAKGHLEKVIQMVEEDTYCVDVLHQSQAVQAALKQADAKILDNHLKTCVVSEIKQGNENVIREIMEVFERK